MAIKLPTPVYDTKLTNFYYAKQLKKHHIQFMEIFSQMQVSSGRNDYNSKSNIIHVPIKYGSADRVVAAIMANNNQNTMLRVPIMAAKMTALDLAADSYSGIGTEDRYTYLPLGASVPDGFKVIYRRKAIPYRVTYELAILASNTDQQNQILEQILLLFDPILQIQTSDAAFDASKITQVELKSITLEENYPPGPDKRFLLTSLIFESIIWISSPYDIRNEYIKKILIRLASIPTYEDVHEVVKDVDRAYPEYDKLFDIADYDVPKQ